MKKRIMLNGKVTLVEDGDSVIRVAEFQTYETIPSMPFVCAFVEEEFDDMRTTFEANVQKEFDKLSKRKQKSIIKERANVSGALVTVTIKDMLQSEYNKIPATPEAMRLFGQGHLLDDDSND